LVKYTKGDLEIIAGELGDEYSDRLNVVSTCPVLCRVRPKELMDNPEHKFGCIVQYLHSYPYNNPLGVVEDSLKAFQDKCEELVFVVAYAAYAEEINRYSEQHTKGTKIRAIFQPMKINDEPLKYRSNESKGYEGLHVVWFGNIYRNKGALYGDTIRFCMEKNINLHVISDGKYRRPNGKATIITQKDAWRVIQSVGRVMAVGRCYLEAIALGCKAIVVGQKYGGYVRSMEDFEAQHSTNFNGRIVTGSLSMEDAIEGLAERDSYFNKITLLDQVPLQKYIFES
jgi:hypothetical protein